MQKRQVNLENRLILQTPKDSSSQSSAFGENWTKKWLKITKSTFVTLVVTLLIAPNLASASFFSIIGEMFGSTASAKEATEPRVLVSSNLAKIPLLESRVSPDPVAYRGGGDIKIVDNQALASEAGPLGSLAEIEERVAANSEISVYVVREGDNLSLIADMFDVTINTIKWANDITSVIKEGDRLVILPISGVRHSVLKGESIKSIATKYKGNIDEILLYNNMTEESSLAIGDIIIIPDGELAASITTVRTSSASAGPSYSGYYVRPTAGIKTQGVHGYNGVDIAGSIGDAIWASASGDVIISREGGWNGGYGNYVVIRHSNGTQTLYAHMSRNLVSAGDYVTSGQVIGLIGSTGKSTGPHLHFEVRGAKNPF